MSKRLLEGCVIATLCLLAACDRPVRLAATKPVVPDSSLAAAFPTQPAEVIPELDAALWPENLPLLQKHYRLQRNFRTFNARAKVHYEGKDQIQDFNATIRIEQDRKIWLSINALGLLEVFRAVLTPDSLQAINRIDRVYYQLPLSEVRSVLPVPADFQMVQSLLTAGILGSQGNVLQTIPADNRISVLLQRQDMQQSLVLAATDSTLQEQTLFNQRAGLRMDIRYERYHAAGNWVFPYEQTIRVSAPDAQVILQLNFEKVSLGGAIEMPFPVPKKYKRGVLR